MRTLILPDIHDQIERANEIIEREPHDQLIFHGDFFDSFGGGVAEARATASQVKEWLDSGAICLLGNHDMAYGWGQKISHICTGYTLQKSLVINSILTPADWGKFRLHTWLGDVQPWLLSHAGVHGFWLDGIRPGRYVDFINEQCEDAWINLNRGDYHYLLDVGKRYGGEQKFGGINWLRWKDMEPITGINQIFGHTPGRAVRYLLARQTTNVCLDTNLRDYAIFDTEGETTLRLCSLSELGMASTAKVRSILHQ